MSPLISACDYGHGQHTGHQQTTFRFWDDGKFEDAAGDVAGERAPRSDGVACPAESEVNASAEDGVGVVAVRCVKDSALRADIDEEAAELHFTIVGHDDLKEWIRRLQGVDPRSLR